MPLPLFAVQILWLNLVTNGIQDVALAFEGGEPGAMKRPPRKPAEGIFNRLMVEQTIVSGLVMGILAFGSWRWMLGNGWEEETARNSVLMLMVLLQNIHVFNCRSEYESAFRVPLRRNVVLVLGVLAAHGIHILALHLPLMQVVLRTEPISLAQWGVLFLLALPLLMVMEIYKLVAAVRELVAIPSWDGNETPAQELMARWMEDVGLDVDLWEIDLAELGRHPAYCAEIPRSKALGLVGTLPGAGGVAPPSSSTGTWTSCRRGIRRSGHIRPSMRW
jgi:hypothetical protein